MASIQGDTNCSIHEERVSSARCPSCEQFFCSECITEHEGQMICLRCLEQQHVKLASNKAKKKRGHSVAAVVAAAMQSMCAAAVIWIIFYFFAQTLTEIPDQFHNGTIWESE